MTLQEVMRNLEAHGTAQNRKIYARHGAGSDQFGVAWAHLRALAKRLAPDQELAVQLWGTGNYDARLLAALIADPAAATSSLLDRWVKDCENYPMTDAVAGYAGRTQFAADKAARWPAADHEWTARAGWNMIGSLAERGETTDALLAKQLQTIESQIHTSPNWVRAAMNMALIRIGVRGEPWTTRALAVAERIGRVEVDHGATECKTPDAASYIRRTLAHRAAKAGTAKARTSTAGAAKARTAKARTAKAAPAGREPKRTTARSTASAARRPTRRRPTTK
jgi:3-methyladenine DNA glycosylase AlkD